jgi:soluble lytic murein transglycosylase-like protein
MRTLLSLGLLVVVAAAAWAGSRPVGAAPVAGESATRASRAAPAAPLAPVAPVREVAGPAMMGAPAAFPPDGDPVWSLADAYSARYGLDDPGVLRALIAAESRGDPGAVNRTAKEWSVGLLQLNLLGGRGAGHSEAELLDPDVNLALSMPEIAAAYRRATAEGYAGARLAVRVAQLAQRPDPSTLWRYAAAYAAPQTARASMSGHI